MRTLLLLASLSVAGLTAAAYSPAPVPSSAMPMPLVWSDSVDAWEGLCSQAEALVDADSLKLPCLVGPGARRPPQLDSIVAGVGTLKVVRITAYTGKADGSLPAAFDSAQAWSNGKTCTVMVFPLGGEIDFDETGSDADGAECVYMLGQTAQGEGINLRNGALHAKEMQDAYFGYFYQRRPFEGYPFLDDISCSQGLYKEHLSNSWGTTQGNLMTFGCGTEAVPQEGFIGRDHTASRNLLFEPDSMHPTFLHTGGWWPDTAGVGSAYVGVNKQARILTYANYMASGGHRTNLFGNADSTQFRHNVVFNTQNAYGQLGSQRVMRSRHDILDSYYRPGPITATGLNRRWAYYPNLGFGDDTTAVMAAGLRTEQNNYALGATPTDIHTGSERSAACDASLSGSSAYTCAADGDSVPLSIWQGVSDTISFAIFDSRLSVAEPPITPLTDAIRDRTIQIAGNSRYLAPNGKWTLRSDSVDERARQEWADSTGVSTASEMNHTGNTYPAPASGTAPADSDLDGLPDLWESEQTGGASTTSIAPDSVLNGLPAILWYGSGRTMDGALIGCDGCSAESGAIAATFGGADRYVYIVPIVTLYGLSLYPDFSPLGTVRLRYTNPAGDTAMVVTCTANGTPSDSATVHARLQAWNLPGVTEAVNIRDAAPFPGMEC